MAGSLIGALRVSLGLDSAQFETGVKKARGEAARASKDMAGGFDTATRAAGALGTAVASIASASVITSLVRVNAQFQTLEARMRVATGSTALAAAELQRLERFAAETPFTLDQVVDGWLKLKNLGLDPNIEALRDYGNIAAASGKSVMDFIEAVADASTNEFERLKEFGIKARQEGDKVTFTFRGIETTVKKDSAAIVGYLRSIATEIGDGMGAQMTTIEGKVSNLDDAFARLMRTIGGLGFNDLFMDQLDKAAKALDYIGRQMSGLQRIRSLEGFGAMMTATADEAVEAGTPEGMLNRLTRQANEATARRIEAERARERGNLGAGNIVSLEARRRAEAEARRRLRDYQAGEYMESVVGRFPLNERGGFGALPAPTKPKDKPDGTGKANGAPNPANKTWLQQARAGDFDSPGWQDPEGMRIVSEEAMNQVAKVQMAIDEIATDVPTIDSSQLFKANAFEAAAEFAEGMARSIGQAVIFSGNIGSALVNSFKAAAAELLTSGLMDMLLGARGVGGQRSGGLIGSLFGIPGFANGTNYAPGGLAIVGERGRELVNLPRGSQVIPNGQTEALMASRKVDVTVGIDPRNGNLTAFVNGQIAATAPAIAQAGAAMAQGQLSQRSQRRFR